MSLQLAEQYEENEQYTQAYEEYKKLHERNPKDLSILERLGHLSMLLDNKEEAAEYYTKILESDATNVLAYEQLMDIYVTTDRYKYYVYRGNMHSVEHQLEHAINDYKKAVNCAQDDNSMLSARFVLGTLYEQTGNNVKAIDEYLKVIDHEGTHEDVYVRLANLYLKEDAMPSAIEVLDRARKSGFDTTNVREMLSDLLLKNGNPEKAIEITSDELTKVKCLLDMGKKSDAIEKLEQMEDQYGHIAQFHSLKAQYYYMNGEYDKALECVNKFDELEKNSPLTYQMRALIFEEKNDDLELLNTLAVLLEESNDKNHAMEFYERIAKLDETDKKSLEKLAEFRESIGDYRMQAEYLLKLYHLDKRNALTVKKLGEAYDKLRNKPAAIECYEKFLEIGKGSPEYSKIQHKLEKLKNSDVQEDEGFLDKFINWFNRGKM